MNISCVVEALNKANQDDPAAIRALILNRIPCNERLAEHPSVLVETTEEGFEVGALGLINGILEPLTGKRVSVMIDEETNKIVGFCEYEG